MHIAGRSWAAKLLRVAYDSFAVFVSMMRAFVPEQGDGCGGTVAGIEKGI